MGRVWLIGGTQESAELARSIVSAGLFAWVTVTTEAARSLYPQHPNLEVWIGRLSSETLAARLQARPISGILDASHPFAAEISQSAIAAAAQLGIPYLRYERPTSSRSASRFSSFEALLQTPILSGERVLLTVGYRPLPLFQPWQERATLFARILPSQTALQAALEAGFTPDRLIALRPPISIDLERALWQQWQISLVVTKASGAPGGEDTKQQLAAELGIQLVTIDRPVLLYPQQTSEISEAIEFCRSVCRSVATQEQPGHLATIDQLSAQLAEPL